MTACSSSAAARARRFWRLLVGGDSGGAPPNGSVLCVASSAAPSSLLADLAVLATVVPAASLPLFVLLDAAAGPSDGAMDPAALRVDLPLVVLEEVGVAVAVAVAVAAAAAGVDLRLEDALDASVPAGVAVVLAVEAVEVLGAALADVNSRRATEAEAEAEGVEEVEGAAAAAMGSHGIGAPIHCCLSSAFTSAAGTV